MGDTTIRPANVAVLIKLQTAEGVEAVPDPAIDAIPVETDSISRTSPWTTEQSSEATGSLVTGAPLVVGQAATVGFRSRIKGAGAGVAYTASVKPPLHAAFQACGWRGQFQAAIAATAFDGTGTTSSAALGAPYSATAQSYRGMPLLLSGATGAGQTSLITDYSAGKIATLSDMFGAALGPTSSGAIPANWTYASTSPSDAATRATDQPPATIWIYMDGVLWKFIDCRGVLNLDGRTARPGFGAFSFSGVFTSRSDAAMPATLAIAGHMAPVLVQGGSSSPSALLNRKPVAISTWSLDAGSQIETPDDPNTTYGFGAGQITDRTPQLKVDPLATLVATRNAIADIGAGTIVTASLRHGSTNGNRWALTTPLAQLIGEADGTRGKLLSEELTLQCRTPGKDSVGRDGDRILTFW